MIPISYSYRNLLVRWRTTLMTAGGFMLVVMALIIMLAFVNGVRTVCAGSGEPQNVLVMKEGNIDEVLSQIDHDMARQAETAPEVLRDPQGRLLASRELFMALTQWDDERNEYYQLQVRGVSTAATAVHTQVRLVEGAMFRRNLHEVIVGRSMAYQRHLRLGDEIPIGYDRWKVVGIFDAAGSAFESEAWCDLMQLAEHFHREGIFSSVVLRTATPEAAQRTVRYLTQSRRVAVEAQTEVDYYQEQAAQTDTIRVGALIVAGFMALGAVFGVTNTMFAAIGERVKDIAVMRLLGFRRREIVLSFLLEALLIALVGATLGSLLGCAVNGLTLSTALGAKSIAFAFTVDAPILIAAVGFAFAMGVVGGLLPAISAMRVDPLDSMR